MKKRVQAIKGSMILALIITTFVVISCTEEVSSKPNFIFKPAPAEGVAAKIGKVTITNEELFGGIRNEIYEAEKKLHEIKMNRLRGLIMEKLMEADPKKKGLSNDEYLEKYISSGATPSKSDIEAFIKERKIPEQHINDQMKERIKQFLEVELKKEAVEKWMAKKTAKSPVEVYLTKPERPVFDVVAGDSPYTGKSDAKVTIVEYSDFQCPFCAKGYKVMNEVKKKYGNKVKIVFKQFPLPFHNHAKTAAEASLCANDQGTEKFWKMHDHMFENQAELDKENLVKASVKLGLAKEKFQTCLDKSTYGAKVDKEMEEGKKLGIKSTPTFFVNGKLVNGAHPIEVFSEIIDEELKK